MLDRLTNDWSRRSQVELNDKDWDNLAPDGGQQRVVSDWLLAYGEQVLTGDSFFHLAAYGSPLPGLNLYGAFALAGWSQPRDARSG